jgi:2'-5' RNA ligase
VSRRLFTSFDEAWAYFQERTEPLVSFWEELSDDDDAVAPFWLILPPGHVKDAAERVQERLASIEGLEPLPRHFSHVTVGAGGDDVPISGRRFEISYPRLACFHEAVVAEAGAPALRDIVARAWPERDLSVFLPHLSLVYARGPVDPAEVRAVLERDTPLGRHVVTEIALCMVPVAKRTLLEPWTVAATVVL